MAMDRFVIALRAQAKYEDELGKKLGINPYSEYGRKKLNEYLDQQRRDDQLRARWHLEAKNPGKFVDGSQILDETLRIRKERLKPYTEEATRQYEEEKIQNGPALVKRNKHR